jgi:predicted branched-subunit amino acid permease
MSSPRELHDRHIPKPHNRHMATARTTMTSRVASRGVEGQSPASAGGGSRWRPHTGPGVPSAMATGAKAMAPWLLGIVPFGLVIGVKISESSVSPLAGCATGLLVYSGSAQLVCIQLLDTGAAPAIVVATVMVINARLALYGASIGSHWRDMSARCRVLAAYLLVDPSYVVGIDAYEDRTPAANRHAHYLGAALLLWVAWQASIAVGVTVGARVPDALRLELVVPLFLTAEIVPRLDDVARRRGSAVAATCAVAGASLPLHAGLGLAIIAGIAVATSTTSNHGSAR